MTKSQTVAAPRWLWTIALVYSVAILAIGLWFSLATGEWIALLSASGLVVVPVGVLAFRSQKP